MQAGLTHWDAVLPTEASVSMRAAMETLAAQYRADNPELTVAQSRADALVDLVLSDVQVSTTATLIIPTTSAPAAEPDPAADPGQDDPSMHDAVRHHDATPEPMSRPGLRTVDQACTTSRPGSRAGRASAGSSPAADPAAV